MQKSSPALLSWLALLTIWIVWGSTYLGMAAAVETIPAFLMTGCRFLIAAPLMFVAAFPTLRNGKVKPTWVEIRNAALLGVVLLLGGTGLVAMAETEIDSSQAALIVSTSPIWMSLMAALITRQKPTIHVIGALVIGIIGIVIMVGTGSGSAPIGWLLMVLASSLCWSGGTVISRFVPLPKNAFLISAIQMVAGGVALLLVAAARGEFHGFTLDQISGKSWTGFLWLVIAGSLIAYTAYMYANQTLPIEIVSTYAYVNPVIAVILGATLDGDVISSRVLIGGAVIVFAVVFIVSGQLPGRKRRKDEA